MGYRKEEDAKYAARKGYSKYKEPRPIYTEDDARRSLKQLKGHDYGRDIEVASGVTIRFHPAGHILGAAHVSLDVQGQRLHFSGDLGDRKSVVSGKSVSVRVDLVGRRIIKKKPA